MMFTSADCDGQEALGQQVGSGRWDRSVALSPGLCWGAGDG